jgi:NADPH:quinone reductase-like Zn-dependent oxidoreductase
MCVELESNRTIVTASSDQKLARAHQLGAAETVNYTANPGWQDDVLRVTNGLGVDLVAKFEGKDTMRRSVVATRAWRRHRRGRCARRR